MLQQDVKNKATRPSQACLSFVFNAGGSTAKLEVLHD